MGCDVLAPSDMMDGRIGKIRKALDKKFSKCSNSFLCCKICF
jgi:delta-aminolevulinic acid dehydratase/porphobilinogen synthase